MIPQSYIIFIGTIFIWGSSLAMITVTAAWLMNFVFRQMKCAVEFVDYIIHRKNFRQWSREQIAPPAPRFEEANRP